MNEQDLFIAIGEADDELLLSQETARKVPLRRAWLIAAVLSLLVITACAAPVIFGAIENAQLAYLKEQDYEVQHFSSREEIRYTLTYKEDVYVVEMEITPAERIPETIETVYYPASVPDDWQGEEAYLNSSMITLSCHWDIRSDEGYRAVVYQQWPLDVEDADGTKTVYVYADPGAEVACQMHTVGQLSVLEIMSTANPQAVQNEDMEHPVVFTTGGNRTFYWSDGEYFFRLYVPYDWDITAVEDVITSLTPLDPSEIEIRDP